ncbi:sporozoite surface protein 2-like [Parasteatoda tepidariorum]|uniref:sporozoite surface protein 2-like n=1 Tax=Parasteatoda tepidariorum TaxID=114398 RepID=UPI0039BD607D
MMSMSLMSKKKDTSYKADPVEPSVKCKLPVKYHYFLRNIRPSEKLKWSKASVISKSKRSCDPPVNSKPGDAFEKPEPGNQSEKSDDPSKKPNPSDPSEKPNPGDISEKPDPEDPSEMPDPCNLSERSHPDNPSERSDLDNPSKRTHPDHPSEKAEPNDLSERPDPYYTFQKPDSDNPSVRPDPDNPSEWPDPENPSERPDPDDPSEKPVLGNSYVKSKPGYLSNNFKTGEPSIRSKLVNASGSLEPSEILKSINCKFSAELAKNKIAYREVPQWTDR